MIVCPRCSKDNQPHYKFCLGCGAELPRDAAQQPKSFSAPTPPSGVPSVAPPPPAAQFGGAAAAPAPAAEPAAPAAAPASTVVCPSCGTQVPANFKFCGSCGHNMAQAPAGSPQAPPASEPAVDGAAQAARGRLVLVQPDGTEGGELPLAETSTVVGRETNPLFANDAFMSPQHATFTFRKGELHVVDDASLNGVYIRIPQEAPVELVDGAVFRIGQEILRFEAMRRVDPGADGVVPMGSPDPGYVGRICLIIGRESTANCFPIPADGAYVGRERGDILFPEDGYVSGLHCRIHAEGDRVFLTDVGSSNGTFMRIPGEAAVPTGSLLLMGQQLFRADY